MPNTLHTICIQASTITNHCLYLLCATLTILASSLLNFACPGYKIIEWRMMDGAFISTNSVLESHHILPSHNSLVNPHFTYLQELWFISPNAAKNLALRSGASDITRIAVQTLNLFLERLLVVYINDASEYDAHLDRFTLTTRSLFHSQDLARRIIEQAWEFTSLFQFRNVQLSGDWSAYSKEQVAKEVRLQCSWYSTLGGGVHVRNPREKALIDLKSAAFLSGTLEGIGRLILSRAAKLVILRSDSIISELTIEEILRTDDAIRRPFVKTDLYNSLGEKRVERFGETPERNVSTYSDKSTILSDSDDDESILTVRTSIDSGCAKGRPNLFVRCLYGLKAKKKRPDTLSRSPDAMEKYLPPKPLHVSGNPKYPRWGSSLSDLSLLSYPHVNYKVDPMKAKKFEELLESEETVKISLTSSRLRSIEVSRQPGAAPPDPKHTTTVDARPPRRKKSFWG
ncbi:hypothetical protein K493DRAFT_393839 [Basidiobolus meristosporus CBS 931.73]|uniref:Uncharacterized protein n=1 Tax=Basidiobolus meristosporus CBS 931.73 TaxID=1314790 RepID=A0A1Y1YNJ3_9FUNG|nr:hypothetical protein K493DRAFT_393839 [Basidiobolus meristosporus CBS 931.73]|eukprot:ORX99336.1 hypothetical protein K493DRAFT_393839 [Basidiobolus meristosporus CBS 931.73]